MTRHRLSSLLEPRSILIIASQPLFALDEMPPPLRRVTTVTTFDATGKPQLPVTLQGVQAGERLDLALVAVEEAQIAPTLSQLGRTPPRAMILYALLTPETVTWVTAWAQDHDCILLGPHSFGMQRPAIGLNASLHPSAARPGKIAFIAQSRAILAAVMDWAEDTQTPFSFVADLGDSPTISMSDMLDFLAFDTRTHSIAIYLEDVDEPLQFMSALRAAASVKPVVILKSGRTQPADVPDALLPDTVFDAALRRGGALRVYYFVQLFSTLKALNQLSHPKGRRLALLANGNGPIQLVQDVIGQQSFITHASLSNETRIQLQSLLSPFAKVNNPIVEPAPLNAETLCASLRALIADDGIDGLLLLLTPDPVSDLAGITDELARRIPQARKPVIVCMPGDGIMRGFRRRLADAGVPAFRTPETAVDAFSQLARFHYNQQLLLQTQPPAPPLLPPDLDTAHAILERAYTRDATELTSAESRRLLAAFGVITHNTMSRRLDEIRPLRIRVLRDRLFGAVIVLDTADRWPSHSSASVELLPLNSYLARRLIERSPAWTRGDLRHVSTPALEQLENLLVAIAEMVVALPSLSSVELEPVYVDDDAVHVPSAKISLCARGLPSVPHLAIAPYPVKWVQEHEFADGTTWTLRPIRPEDAEPLQDFVRGLSSEARYMRFVSAIRELPPRMLARYTQIDYYRELALVATVQEPNPRHRYHPHEVIVGLAHYLLNPDGIGAEYALVVSDRWQRRGLGRSLMRALIKAAREQGLRYLEGHVLTTNRPMLRLMTSLGFRHEALPDDPSMQRVWLEL